MEFGNFAKTQGIWFAQVVNSLILKVKDISIFAAKLPNLKKTNWISLPSQFCVCYSHKSCKLAQGKFAVGQGKHREFENEIGVDTLRSTFYINQALIRSMTYQKTRPAYDQKAL